MAGEFKPVGILHIKGKELALAHSVPIATGKTGRRLSLLHQDLLQDLPFEHTTIEMGNFYAGDTKGRIAPNYEHDRPNGIRVPLNKDEELRRVLDRLENTRGSDSERGWFLVIRDGVNAAELSAMDIKPDDLIIPRSPFVNKVLNMFGKGIHPSSISGRVEITNPDFYRDFEAASNRRGR